MEAFMASVTAGTYTSTASTIAIDGASTPLWNAPTPDDPETPVSRSLTFTASDADGDPVDPGPSSPLHVTIYGGTPLLSDFEVGSTPISPTVSTPDMVSFELTSAPTTLSFTYDGGYLAAPLTVQAYQQLSTTSTCSGTPEWTIGAATIPLGQTPAEEPTETASLEATCSAGLSGTACATDNVDSYGVRLDAAVGYAAGAPTTSTAPVGDDPDTGDYDRYTVDTGSLGVAVPATELGPNAIGPAGPAYKYYDSTGYEYIGLTYLAPVTFRHGGGTVTTRPVRVLAVFATACNPDAPGCTPPGTDFHYLGVGFDRNVPAPGSPFASPADNALLQAVGDYGQGYMIGGTGVRLGLTDAQTAGFDTVDLTASSTVPGDWLTAPGSVAVTSPSGTPDPIAGTVLVDTGIAGMFVSGPVHVVPELHSDDTITVSVADPFAPAPLEYSFLVGLGGQPAEVGLNPSSVSRVEEANVFVNTGRHVLFGYDVLYDARAGRYGFSQLGVPLRSP
jgi:hypothetical protein